MTIAAQVRPPTPPPTPPGKPHLVVPRYYCRALDPLRANKSSENGRLTLIRVILFVCGPAAGPGAKRNECQTRAARGRVVVIIVANESNERQRSRVPVRAI